MFISCKQCYVPSIGIGQVSAIFYLKSISIGSAGENWYQCIAISYIIAVKSLLWGLFISDAPIPVFTSRSDTDTFCVENGRYLADTDTWYIGSIVY